MDKGIELTMSLGALEVFCTLDAVVDLTTAVDVETMMLIGTEDRVSGSDVVEEAKTDLETEVALEATDL